MALLPCKACAKAPHTSVCTSSPKFWAGRLTQTQGIGLRLCAKRHVSQCASLDARSSPTLVWPCSRQVCCGHLWRLCAQVMLQLQDSEHFYSICQLVCVGNVVQVARCVPNSAHWLSVRVGFCKAPIANSHAIPLDQFTTGASYCASDVRTLASFCSTDDGLLIRCSSHSMSDFLFPFSPSSQRGPAAHRNIPAQTNNC